MDEIKTLTKPASMTNTVGELLMFDMREYILRKALNGPVWGYKIISDVRRKTHKYPSASQVYPMLDKLSEEGLLNKETVYIGRRPRNLFRAVFSKTREELKRIRDTKNIEIGILNELSGGTQSIQYIAPETVEATVRCRKEQNDI